MSRAVLVSLQEGPPRTPCLSRVVAAPLRMRMFLECLSCIILKVLLSVSLKMPGSFQPTSPHAWPSCPLLYLTLALRPMQELGARLGAVERAWTSCHSQKTAPAPRTKVGEIRLQKVLEVLPVLPQLAGARAQAFQPHVGWGRGMAVRLLSWKTLGMSDTPGLGSLRTWRFSSFCCCLWSFCEEDEDKATSPALPPYLPWPVFPVLWAFNFNLGMR